MIWRDLVNKILAAIRRPDMPDDASIDSTQHRVNVATRRAHDAARRLDAQTALTQRRERRDFGDPDR